MQGSSIRRRGRLLALAASLALAAWTLWGQQATLPRTGDHAIAGRGAGGGLNIQYWQAPMTLNAHRGTGTKDTDAARLVSEPLASWDKSGNALANGLAKEIPSVQNGSVSRDFTTVTWRLRTGVKWSDGSPFSADDVVATFMYQCDERTAAATVDVCEGVSAVTARDPSTVIVTYAAPQPFYLQWGVGSTGLILQEAQYANCMGLRARDCPADDKPIGTGPYRVNTFKPGEGVTYDLNENYRDPNRPFFRTVVLKGGGTPMAAARSIFETGDIDYAWNLQIESDLLSAVSSKSQMGNLVTVYGSSIEQLLIQFADPSPSVGVNRGEPTTRHPFFADLRVRKALAMSTNRAALVPLFGDGLVGRATCNILVAPEPMNSRDTDLLDVCKFDQTAASQLLTEAGWILGEDGVRSKEGVRLNVLYQTALSGVRQKVQAILKAGWESVGFKVELKSVPSATFYSNTSPDGASHFWADVEMFSNFGYPDPTSYFSSGWSTAQAASRANNWQLGNYSRYSNKDFDAVVDRLRAETDGAKRTQLAIDANDILVRDVAVIPLINRTSVVSGVSKALKNVDPSPWDSELYNIADWSK